METAAPSQFGRSSLNLSSVLVRPSVPTRYRRSTERASEREEKGESHCLDRMERWTSADRQTRPGPAQGTAARALARSLSRGPARARPPLVRPLGVRPLLGWVLLFSPELSLSRRTNGTAPHSLKVVYEFR